MNNFRSLPYYVGVVCAIITAQDAQASAEPSPTSQSSCDALSLAAHDSALNMDKIHGIAQTISPALPHPDNPELHTGQVNIIDLFFKAHDLSRSLRQSSSELRAALATTEIDELAESAENLADVNDETAVAFSNSSNPLAPRPPMEELASSTFDTVSDAIEAFEDFNDLYVHYCDIDLMPDYEE